MLALRAVGLNKSYGEVEALKEVSLEVERGELYGIIGPDGAGKTSLFRILTTLLLADSGSATLNGLDVVKEYKKIRTIIGYMPGRFSLYQDLTIEENLNFFATIYNTTIEENYHLVEDIYKQIEPFKKRKAGNLSGGMKQKLALSCALIHKPSILFLDEPTTGIDPVSRKELWDLLIKLKEEGITIIASTPYMDEATLCDRIALIQDGEILEIDTPESIVESYPDKLWAVKSEEMHRLLRDLRSYPLVKSSFTFGEAFHVTFKTGTASQALEAAEVSEGFEAADVSKGLKSYLEERGHIGIEIEVIEPTVEDAFMLLSTKGNGRDG